MFTTAPQPSPFARLSRHARQRNATLPGRRADTPESVALAIVQGSVDMRAFAFYTPAFVDLIMRTVEKLAPDATLADAQAALPLAVAEQQRDHFATVAHTWLFGPHGFITLLQAHIPATDVLMVDTSTWSGTACTAKDGPGTFTMRKGAAVDGALRTHAVRVFRDAADQDAFLTYVRTARIFHQHPHPKG